MVCVYVCVCGWVGGCVGGYQSHKNTLQKYLQPNKTHAIPPNPYTTPTHQHNPTQKQVPLAAYGKLTPPAARGDFKLTIDVGGPSGALPLTEVFADLAARAPSGTCAANILTFQLPHSGDVVGGVVSVL